MWAAIGKKRAVRHVDEGEPTYSVVNRAQQNKLPLLYKFMKCTAFSSAAADHSVSLCLRTPMNIHLRTHDSVVYKVALAFSASIYGSDASPGGPRRTFRTPPPRQLDSAVIRSN